MADSDLKDCPCSNITIMQLFHELKQKYPKIPDQIVSRVIEQNFHNKTACETILQRESHHYLQSYPGALISGTSRDLNEPLCRNCPVVKTSDGQQIAVKGAWVKNCKSSAPNKKAEILSASKIDNILDSFSSLKEIHVKGEVNMFEDKSIHEDTHSEIPKNKNEPMLTVIGRSDSNCVNKIGENWVPKQQNAKLKETSKKYKRINCEKSVSCNAETDSDQIWNSSSSTGTETGTFADDEDLTDNTSDSSSVKVGRTSKGLCDIGCRKENLLRSQSSLDSSLFKELKIREVETLRWTVDDGGRKSAVISGIISHLPSTQLTSAHNYQVAVECSMQPISPDSIVPGEQARSFTSVNLSLRPPSSEPQPPIEIQSSRSLTYTTSSFDPKKGYQSQLQIRIEPGDGGTFSACQTYISAPQFRFSSAKSSHCISNLPTSHRGFNRHRLKALIEKQKERKDLLACELRREKEKLRFMQNEMRLMNAAIAQRPNPRILPRLKAEILRLRTECERLTAAVDMYSSSRSNLPLGETNEEFYHNIYTGQRFQREGSWSCELCTFRNHPLLSVCEECEMPRLSLGTTVEDVAPPLSVFSNNNNTSICTGAGTSTSA